MVENKITTLNPLPVELQRQLDFKPDLSGEWLQNNDFVQIGGMHQHEFLPGAARLSADGTRWEVGAYIDDLEGLLALARLVRPSVQTVNAIADFWKDHPRYSTTVEGDMLYIGASIEPTEVGLEKAATPIGFAYDIALEGALEGKSRDDFAQEKGTWYGDLLKEVESPGESRTVFFNQENPNPEPEAEESCPITPAITVDSLREYPIGEKLSGLMDAPGSLKLGDQIQREFNRGSWIVLQSEDSRFPDNTGVVEIHILESDRKSFRDERPNDGFTLYMLIPEGEEVKTIEDVARLSKGGFYAKSDTEGKYEPKVTDLAVSVEDDTVKIVSEEEDFEIKLEKPCCPECKTARWKWPDRRDLTMRRDVRPDQWGDNAHLFGYSAGGGEPPRFRPYFSDKEGKHLNYCGNCITTVVERYQGEHPYASRSKAIEQVRQELDTRGYQDVDILETDVWNEQEGTWSIFTKVEYERDGRTIMRYTGSPQITHDGEFDEADLFPHEYVTFRHKA